MIQHHLAIFYRAYLDAVLAGTKTIECRLSRTGNIPHCLVKPGDLLWLKESAGPVRAVATAGVVRGFRDLAPTRIDWLRRRFNAGIGGVAPFWRQHRDARHATLIWLDNVCPLPPFNVIKRDRRAWVVLAGPPVPGEPILPAPVDLA
ncbi:MAG TPA: ASCH domain-containing protein [Phycisphaerae bacterium]|nr:ASCH domain-containing protein [Phycisphaerae bacterium]